MPITFSCHFDTKPDRNNSGGRYRNHGRAGMEVGVVQFVAVELALCHLYVVMDQEDKSGSGDRGGL